MTRTDVALCFKGDRTYLHGTDVYTSAVAMLHGRWPDVDGRCRFTFHRLARKPLTAWMDSFSAGRMRPGGCVAEMHVTGRNAAVSIWFTERDGEVACRYAYDEDAVVRDSVVAGSRIVMTRAPSNAPIEVLVALTKRLHYALLTPAGGRWLLTRLDLQRLLREDDRAAMSVTMIGTPRVTLTRSEIAVGGQPLGSIFFSVGAA